MPYGTVPKALPRRLVLATAMFFISTITGGLTPPAHAEPINREYKLKVAYLYNFGRYMQWPRTAFQDNNAPFVIGILGDDPFKTSIDALASKKKIHGRKIVVKRFTNVSEYTSCQMLFVSQTNTLQVRQAILKTTSTESVLLVGESDGFSISGGSASFFNDVNGTVGFRINIDTLARKAIVADAKLLKLATIVQDSGSRTSQKQRGDRR